VAERAIQCPICERRSPAYADRCTACGADFHDPEVRALIGAPPAAGTPPGAADPTAGAGTASLASDRFFGVSAAGLADGRHLTRVAWAGGILLAAAFLVPVDPDFRGLRMPWSLLGGGLARSLAVILPLLLGAAAVELAVIGKRLPRAAVAGGLAATGLLAFGLCVPPLAHGAGATAAHLPWLVWLGVAAAAVGLGARVLRPLDRTARWVIAGGGALVLFAMVVPHGDTTQTLPIDFSMINVGGLDVSRLSGNLNALVDGTVEVRLLAFWQLVPLVLVPVAFALALRQPSGPWDTRAHGLRPVGWVVVPYVAIWFALYALDAMGWPGGAFHIQVDGHWLDGSTFSTAVVAGRLHLALIALGATAWLVGGASALYLRLVPGPGPAAATEPPPAASEPD
jgi:hypothetical protein